MRFIIYLLALITGLCSIQSASAACADTPVAVASAQYSDSVAPAHHVILEQQVRVLQQLPRKADLVGAAYADAPLANFANSTPIIRAERAHI